MSNIAIVLFCTAMFNMAVGGRALYEGRWYGWLNMVAALALLLLAAAS